MAFTRGLMMRETGFFLVSVALLAGNLAAIGTSGRERAKRAVCLANLNQLMSAWSVYADQNDGKIVNGVGGFHYLKSGSNSQNGLDPAIVERAWVGRGWSNNWNNPNVADTGVTEFQKKRAIQEGALWPLTGDTRLYKCPIAKPYEWVNYSIVDAMNGLNASNGRTGVSTGANHVTAVGTRIGDTVLWIKRRAEIISPPPAERMVFIDEGAMTPDSFGVNYQQPAYWWDGPPTRHNDGTTVSWADGHASYLQWQGAETIAYGRQHQDYYGGGFLPKTPEGKKDLDDLCRAVWGRLGY